MLIRLFFMILSLSLWWIGAAEATTRNAATCNTADVQTQVNASSTGDTVACPAGSFTWSGLTVDKGITIQGAGAETATTCPAVPSAGATKVSLSGGNTFTKSPAGVMIIRDIAFTASGAGNAAHPISIGGSWLAARPIIFQNNSFVVNGSGLFRPSVAGGWIIANNKFWALWDDSILQPKNPNDTDNSWHRNSTFGMRDTASTLSGTIPGTSGELNGYYEDNISCGAANQGIDMDDGSRVVVRHNTFKYGSVNSHGTDTSPYGVRHFEIYNNVFQNTSAGGWTGSTSNNDLSNTNWAIWIRGGTGVIYNNVIDDYANSNWGFAKSEAKFDIRAQQDNSGVSYGTVGPPTAKYSAGQGNYPRERQLAQSWNESLSNPVGINGGVGDYSTDPIYAWGNTGAGSSGGSFLGWSNGGSWGSQAGYFETGRDYVFGNTPKPGYTAFTYPHPLRTSGNGDTVPPIPPTNLHVN